MKNFNKVTITIVFLFFSISCEKIEESSIEAEGLSLFEIRQLEEEIQRSNSDLEVLDSQLENECLSTFDYQPIEISYKRSSRGSRMDVFKIFNIRNRVSKSKRNNSISPDSPCKILLVPRFIQGYRYDDQFIYELWYYENQDFGKPGVKTEYDLDDETL